MQAHKQALNKYLITRPENEYLYNNETGTAYTSNEVYRQGRDVILKNARVVKYGLLGVGGPDLIGMTILEVTTEMVGMKIPVFSSVEMKVGKDRLRPEQKRWNQLLTKLGCNSKVIFYDGEAFKEVAV